MESLGDVVMNDVNAKRLPGELEAPLSDGLIRLSDSDLRNARRSL